VSGTATPAPTSPFAVPSSALPGGESVSIFSALGLNFRDRGNFSDANHGGLAELLEDYLRAGTGLTSGAYPTMTLDIGNLIPNTLYDATMRLYDGGIAAAAAGTYTFAVTGTNDLNPANNVYSVDFEAAGGTTTLAEQAGHTERFLSTAAGTLQITLEQTSGTERTVPLNSLDVVAVPEPEALAFAVVGAVTSLGRRRRTRT
jgi:hypothetical protein